MRFEFTVCYLLVACAPPLSSPSPSPITQPVVIDTDNNDDDVGPDEEKAEESTETDAEIWQGRVLRAVCAHAETCCSALDFKKDDDCIAWAKRALGPADGLVLHPARAERCLAIAVEFGA
jgi:hypothetical protein